MSKKPEHFRITDGNEAVASVAFRLSEIVTIYPITPSSPMAEFCDEWAAKGLVNLWGNSPVITEMQSEAGVAGSVHGALQCGSITTTFTASQGLLLMIPNMYKIAGELLPFCMHVSARAIATHALSIFGDHSDVMACRSTGFALLASNSPQEAQDLAAIATAATFETRVPFLHFFDGFRTSHEINTYEYISDEILKSLLDSEKIEAFRKNAMNPDQPTVRGTAQNPDVFFQAREANNPFYAATPDKVQALMERFHQLTGRSYSLFDYAGASDAETVFVMMGSGAETTEETCHELNQKSGKLGIVKVRLYRPFDAKRFVQCLPSTTKNIIVLDRTKELGALGEPLYLDVCSAIEETRNQGILPANFQPQIFGGRYGLGSKEYSPAMVKGIVDAIYQQRLPRHFTIGIEDDVSHLSVPFDATYELPKDRNCFSAIFFGLGSDGTVGANKNTIKIIGSETPNFAQAYFTYDSKKSGAMTVSHLRFGPEPIHAPYLVQKAQFIGCHQFPFLEKFDVLRYAAKGGIFLLNSPYSCEEIQQHLPQQVQQKILDLGLKFYTIDAYKVANECGMDQRINTIMQTCFFAISGILPKEEAIAQIKKSIEKTYSKKGRAVVEKNFACVDASVANLFEVKLDAKRISEGGTCAKSVCGAAPEFVKNVIAPLLRDEGNDLPVSKIPLGGIWPTATSQWEKRNIAQEVPIWDPSVCIQCGKCSVVCPHAAIRTKYYSEELLKDAPEGFRSTDYRSRDEAHCKFTVQVAPEDCTGCGLCISNCPAKSKTDPEHKAINFQPRTDVVEQERKNYEFFLQLPNPDVAKLSNDVKGSQLRQPLFEYSGACAGCGETPYIKLLTQLFGDHLVIANTTGCSSIYSGNLPTTPYCKNQEGRGPAWANSLFEDNAEFGLGMWTAFDQQRQAAATLLEKNKELVGESLVEEILSADQSTPAGIQEQRRRIEEVQSKICSSDKDDCVRLHSLVPSLVKKSIWILGGDGWAYDIGFGGLDHVIASGKNVKILVLDTEVYSNTGGQQSKATPRGAVAKFAAGGKSNAKKDLGRIAMTYGNVYVAQVALGAKDSQTLNAFLEAEAYDGPALIIAYCPCISHGYDMSKQLHHQKLAVDSGYWPLYRFNPAKAARGENPFTLDSKSPSIPVEQYMETENRFNLLKRTQPERAEQLTKEAQDTIAKRFAFYEQLTQNSAKREG